MFNKKVFSYLVILLFLTCNLFAAHTTDFNQKYQLKQVLVLSRHHIRSPLSAPGSALSKLTPHAWFNWTSGPSELSLLGGELETLLGQYFRKWLVSEGLITENYIPKSGEMRFYANSMQRTIATAQYFSTGMLPVANVRIEHRYAPGKMDPMFEPRLTFMSEAYRQLAMQQIEQMGGEKGLQGINERLQSQYNLLEKVLDLKNSELAKEGFTHFRTDDLTITLEPFKEPAMSGSLKKAAQASDALILQYYEENDPVKAAFGHSLTPQEWEQLTHIKEFFQQVLFSSPAISTHVAYPLIKEMKKELSHKNRKFTFLCGHDSNLSSVLLALNANPHDALNTYEKAIPIGSKLVFSKWEDANNNEYISIDLVYQTNEQIKNRTLLSLDTPPEILPISLQNMQQNEDGLYKFSDVKDRFQQAIDQYKALKKMK